MLYPLSGLCYFHCSQKKIIVVLPRDTAPWHWHQANGDCKSPYSSGFATGLHDRVEIFFSRTLVHCELCCWLLQYRRMDTAIAGKICSPFFQQCHWQPIVAYSNLASKRACWLYLKHLSRLDHVAELRCKHSPLGMSLAVHCLSALLELAASRHIAVCLLDKLFLCNCYVQMLHAWAVQLAIKVQPAERAFCGG